MGIVGEYKSVHSRIGPLIDAPGGARTSSRVCRFFLRGSCNRSPCPFLHVGSPASSSDGVRAGAKRAQNDISSVGSSASSSDGARAGTKRVQNDMSSVGTKRGGHKWVRGQEIVRSGNVTPSAGVLARVAPAFRASGAPAFVANKTYAASKNNIFEPSKIPVAFTRAVEMAAASAKLPASSSRVSVIVRDSTVASKASKFPVSPDNVSKAVDNLHKICDPQIKEGSNEAKTSDVHSSTVGNGYTFLASLVGHNKSVTGIALSEGCDKLYTGSEDRTIRVWDCHTGQCTKTINVEAEVGCLIVSGSWIFVGLPNLLKAWNVGTNTDLSLFIPGGQVRALVVANNTLFCGAEDGTILAWSFNTIGKCFDPPTSMTGHSLAVTSLYVGSVKLYSGSKDNTVKVWDLANFQCLHTLKGHTSAVMSVLCWNEFLLSSSLDNTIKVWAMSEKGVEVIYTHKEDHGVINLCGVFDSNKKLILLCACDDGVVHLYDMPSFSERGRVLSNGKLCSLQGSPNGLFFTGSSTGEVKVWKLLCKDDATQRHELHFVNRSFPFNMTSINIS